MKKKFKLNYNNNIVFVKINNNKITKKKTKNKEMNKKKKLVSSPSMTEQYFVGNNLLGE